MKKRSALARVRGIAVFVIVMALLAAFCGWLWYNHETGRPTGLFGYEWMSMSSREMEPEIPRGSLLLLKEVPPEELEPGEMIVSGRENGRGGSVRRVPAEGVDAEGEDTFRQVTYVIPAAGMVWDFLLTPKGVLLVLGIPCALFLLLELAGWFLFTRRGRKEDVPPSGLPSDEEDARENFVDVTKWFTGPGSRRRYQEMEPEDGPDKFADLEFNPLMEKRASSQLETVEIPDGKTGFLKLLVDGREAASLPLEGPKNTRIKSAGWRIDITIALDEDAGK
ncbi:MAG TPA: hypothetical protein IAC82_12370 [Candidatus Merdivicinus intestinigallinarum]|nr:hypothetical protein [Candidatus Merdivicinus intestinigallinarum]